MLKTNGGSLFSPSHTQFANGDVTKTPKDGDVTKTLKDGNGASGFMSHSIGSLMGEVPKTDWSSIRVSIPEEVKAVVSQPVVVNKGLCVCQTRL